MRRTLILLSGLSLVMVWLAADPGATTAQAVPQPKRDQLDEAIDRALEFLSRSQSFDGSWRVGSQRNAGLTGLAVMAFLAAGHVPGEGPYSDALERGIRWVLAAQRPNGLITTDGNQEMYHHGICSLMLAEAAGMCSDRKLNEEVRQKLAKAIQVILIGQRKAGAHRGGWRYRVDGTDSDISVSGWQLLALRAAKNLGCDVPAESIDEAVQYLKRSRDPGSGGYRYMVNGPVTVPCTGTSILALELCGKEHHGTPEVLRAGAFLLKNPPRWGQLHFPYSIYYCSQAAFQLGDNYWSYYRPQLHDVLLRNQSDNGCWISPDQEGRLYGPNYCTAMAVLALTVEYRFLPIYQRGEEPMDRPKE